MTVLLVLGFFVVFIVIDYALNRRKAIATVAVEPSSPAPAQAPGEFVDGFLTPEALAYHPGHSWLVKERKNVFRIGADEFAAALTGKVERSNCPSRDSGSAGAESAGFFRDGQKTEMVSPTEGEVMEVNAKCCAIPPLCARTLTGRAG